MVHDRIAPSGMTHVLIVVAIQASCVVMACFAVPLALNSNIWPIAGAMWSVLTVPVAIVIGVISGWLLSRQRTWLVLVASALIGAALALATGMLIVRFG